MRGMLMPKSRQPKPFVAPQPLHPLAIARIAVCVLSCSSGGRSGSRSARRDSGGHINQPYTFSAMPAFEIFSHVEARKGEHTLARAFTDETCVLFVAQMHLAVHLVDDFADRCRPRRR